MGTLIEGVVWPVKRPQNQADEEDKCSTCVLKSRLEQAHVCLHAAAKLLDVVPAQDEPPRSHL